MGGLWKQWLVVGMGWRKAQLDENGARPERLWWSASEVDDTHVTTPMTDPTTIPHPLTSSKLVATNVLSKSAFLDGLSSPIRCSTHTRNHW